MHTQFRLRKYFRYWLDAMDEHSMHSPFLFDIYTKVIKPRGTPNGAIEMLRAKLKKDSTQIVVEDFGGGNNGRETTRLTSELATASASPAKFSMLYQRLASHLFCQEILELGTSLGLNTLYLASVSGSRVTTLEGAPALAALAQHHATALGFNNIQIKLGEISKTLPRFLQDLRRVDMAFIDANHLYEPTVNYFNWLLPKTHPRSVIIIDDIYHSPEMERAWNTIKNHTAVYSSVDLYRCGMVFFDPSLNKQHAVLQF